MRVFFFIIFMLPFVAAFAAQREAAVVDIMVVYTTAAKTGAGSASALETAINKQIQFTNTIFKNSGITATVRLVHTEEVAFQETGDANADLRTLTNFYYVPGFGSLPGAPNAQSDPIHALRDKFGADIVVLVEENPQTFQHIGILSLEFHVDKLSRPLL